MGLRYDRLIPLVIGILGDASMVFLIALFPSPLIYIAAGMLEAFFFFFVFPYFIGFLAALDPNGRWTAAGSDVMLLGLGLGPAIGGVIVRSLGYELLGVSVLVGGFISATIIVYTVRNYERVYAP